MTSTSITRYKLHEAVLMQNHSKVLSLIESGYPLNNRDDDGLTPLHYAAGLKSYEIFKSLVTAQGISINAQTDLGAAPIHFAAMQGSASHIKLLLAHGAKVEGTTDGECTPLHLAASYGTLETLKKLLKSDADPNAIDANGNTPLYYAAKNFYKLRALIKYKANPNIENKQGIAPLHIAVKAALSDNVRALIEAGAKFEDNPIFEDGKTSPMHIAAELENPEMLKLLIEYRVPVDSVDQNLDTPLHLAIDEYNIEHVKILTGIPHIDVDAQNIDGETPLHFAIDSGDMDIIKTLVEADADPTITDKDNFTPLDDAEYSDNSAAYYYLKEIIDKKTKIAEVEYSSDSEGEGTPPPRTPHKSPPKKSPNKKRKAEDIKDEANKRSKDDSAYESAYETESRETSDDEHHKSTILDSPAATLILFDSPDRKITNRDVANLQELENFHSPKKFSPINLESRFMKSESHATCSSLELTEEVGVMGSDI